MTGSQKLRVAVGAIDNLNQLQDTIVELMTSGAATDDMVVLTIPGNLCERLLTASESTSTGEAEEWPAVLVRSKGDDTAVKQKSADKGTIGTTSLFNLSAGFEDWIESRLAQNLNHHLANGACLLFVQIVSPETEIAISNALLSHSLDLVQFHDVVPPT